MVIGLVPVGMAIVVIPITSTHSFAGMLMLMVPPLTTFTTTFVLTIHVVFFLLLLVTLVLLLIFILFPCYPHGHFSQVLNHHATFSAAFVVFRAFFGVLSALAYISLPGVVVSTFALKDGKGHSEKVALFFEMQLGSLNTIVDHRSDILEHPVALLQQTNNVYFLLQFSMHAWSGHLSLGH